eukprot:144003_1
MHFCVPFTPVTLPNSVLILLTTTLSLSTLIYAIKKSVSLQNLFKSFKSILILYYVICLLWCLQTIINIISTIFILSNIFCAYLRTILYIGHMCYFVGLFNLYVMFVLRLKYNFIDNISECKYYFFLSGVVIWILLFICIPIHWTISHDFDAPIIERALFLILYFVYSTLLLVQYLINIIQTHINSNNIQNEIHSDSLFIHETTNPKTTTSDTNNIDTKHSKTSQVVRLMVKYTLCYCVAFITTITLAAIRVIIKPSRSDILLFHMLSMSMDSFINVICLHLQFTYGNTFYIKLCYYFKKPLEMYALNRLSKENKVDVAEIIPSKLPQFQLSITSLSGESTTCVL